MMNNYLKALFIITVPFILFTKPLYISNEYYLIENDSLSPSMTYTYEGIKVPGLTDTTLKIFSDPETYYREHNALYCKDYSTLRDLYDRYPHGASLNYVYQDHTEILFKSRKYLSLGYTHFAFTGGAHPNTTSQYWIINRKNGRIISYDDLFIAGSEQKIKALTDEELKRTFQRDDLENILFSTDYDISKDIYLIRRGVVFQYDQYEIVPYSYGQIEIFIPYKKLRSVLR